MLLYAVLCCAVLCCAVLIPSLQPSGVQPVSSDVVHVWFMVRVSGGDGRRVLTYRIEGQQYTHDVTDPVPFNTQWIEDVISAKRAAASIDCFMIFPPFLIDVDFITFSKNEWKDCQIGE